MTRWMFVLATLGASAVGFAQDQGDTTGFDEDLFTIEGKVQRPEVEVVIGRENVDKAFDIELRESFLQRIIDSLGEPIF